MPDAYIPTSLPPEPLSIFYYLKLNSGVGHKEACLKGFVTPLYTAIVVLSQAFPTSWGIISHMLVLATPSSTVHKTKTWILTTEAILVLAACS